MVTTFNLDEFKEQMRENEALRESITNKSDFIDFDNGSMKIHRCNLNKYLEKYLCKNEEDFEDTMWYSYGIYVKIVD